MHREGLKGFKQQDCVGGGGVNRMTSELVIDKIISKKEN